MRAKIINLVAKKVDEENHYSNIEAHVIELTSYVLFSVSSFMSNLCFLKLEDPLLDRNWKPVYHREDMTIFDKPMR